MKYFSSVLFGDLRWSGFRKKHIQNEQCEIGCYGNVLLQLSLATGGTTWALLRAAIQLVYCETICNNVLWVCSQYWSPEFWMQSTSNCWPHTDVCFRAWESVTSSLEYSGGQASGWYTRRPSRCWEFCGMWTHNCCPNNNISSWSLGSCRIGALYCHTLRVTARMK